MATQQTINEMHRGKARAALRRGAEPGKPIPSCACFQDGLISRRRCVGVCEDAVDWVAHAIAEAEVGDTLTSADGRGAA